MTVTIRTRTVGQAFGVVAEIIDHRGRVIATSPVHGLGNTPAAIARAEDICARAGWSVRR